MAFALVGTIGAVTTGSSGASVTPAWGTSESRTAGNLLILWVEGNGSLTLPAAPSGWTVAKQLANTSTSSASIFYKIAVGADAAPTVALVTSTILSAQLAEFSGGATSSPLDQTASGTSTATSALTITNGGVDAQSGELLIASSCAGYASTTGTKTDVLSSNNATLTNTTNSAAVADIYAFAYGVTTSNAAADTVVSTYYTSHTPNVATVGASFKLLVPSTSTSLWAGAPNIALST